MKTTPRRRLLSPLRSLLLALAMCLVLAPSAWAAENTDYVDITDPKESSLYMKKGEERTLQADASGPFAWESSDKSVVSVNNSTATITAKKAGEANIRAFLRQNTEIRSDPLHVIVSGIVVPDEYADGYPIPVKSTTDLMLVVMDWCVGDVNEYDLKFINLDYDILDIDDGIATALRPGEAEVEVEYSFLSSTGRETEKIKIVVERDPNTIIDGGTITTNDNMPFSKLNIPTKLGGSNVAYITGLYVSTEQGILYYDYQSEADPGAGVGQGQSYYPDAGAGQQALDKITFVPRSDYGGGSVTITFNAVTEDYQNHACEINLKVKKGYESNTPQTGSVSLETEYGSAVHFNSAEMAAVCREMLGAQLGYVIFTQPPAFQGVLYTNYISEGNYGSVVDTRAQYRRNDLDDIWFVPTPGFSGDVIIHYTGFSTDGKSYSGQVTVKVEAMDQKSFGGLAYNTSPGAAARFNENDFENYRNEIMGGDKDSQPLSGIRVESLPDESEGVLYYDYQSSGSPGVRAEAGTVFYCGSRIPSIGGMAFVPAEDFTGTVLIPFTGWTMDGTSFSGSIQINVRGTGGLSRDIYYYCTPGGSVSFESSDFVGLSRAMTGRTLNYISFRGLPDASEGRLYYGASPIGSLGTSYRGSSIDRISFRASKTFSGLVNIPFELYSTDPNGKPFYGMMTVGDRSGGTGNTGSSGSTENTWNTGSTWNSGNSSSTGSSLSGAFKTARYSTRTAPVRLNADDLARDGISLSSIQFTSLPSPGAGYLYYQYSSPIHYGQQVSAGTTYHSSGGSLISDLFFLPRAGYSGTAVIPYTGTNSNGSTFEGEVEITVSPSYNSTYFSDMAGYSSSQAAAVDFLYDQGVTHGLTAGQYGPQVPLRRGDFALMLYQAFEFSPTTYLGTFADVSSDAYYATAVNTLSAHGVVSGTGSGRYDPDSALTRQDAICMVQRAMRSAGWSAGDGNVTALAGFSDSSSVSGYAQGAMAMAVQRGLLPTTGNMLNPLQPLNRVDMAELLHRALTY